MQIDLTQDEAKALLQLMDLGVKAGGLAVAANATHLLAKINAAGAEANKSKTNGAAPHTEEARPPA